MATSQNGWPVLTSSTDDSLVPIPRIAGRVRKGDVAWVFSDLINRFDKEVEDVDDKSYENDWGYAYRPIRGQDSGFSNHSSGTAIDLNADKHPLGVEGTFTSAQYRKINSLLRKYGGAIRWGGTYPDRKDEMHFEINVSESKLRDIVAKLKSNDDLIDIDPVGVVKPIEPVKPVRGSEKNERIQRILRSLGYYKGIIDGINGPMQKAAVKRYQSAQVAPFKLVSDGDWGNITESHYQWVIVLQKALNEWRSTSGVDIAVDGVHGRVTVTRVKDIQRRNRGGRYQGKIDGWAGPMMCRMLGIRSHP